MLVGMQVRQTACCNKWSQPQTGGRGGAADVLSSPVSFPSLRENSISKEGGPAIARALRTNSTLRKLE